MNNSLPSNWRTTTKKRNNYTDNQVAKKAGVGVGTVAHYNKVMNFNDEDVSLSYGSISAFNVRWIFPYEMED